MNDERAGDTSLRPTGQDARHYRRIQYDADTRCEVQEQSFVETLRHRERR